MLITLGDYMCEEFNYHDRKEEDFEMPTEETVSLYDDPYYGSEYDDPEYCEDDEGW